MARSVMGRLTELARGRCPEVQEEVGAVPVGNRRQAIAERRTLTITITFRRIMSPCHARHWII